jgi:phage shock protein PspC (stress-responsive transcriptional regulator)
MTDLTTRSCPSCYASIDARASRCQHCGQRQSTAALVRDQPGRVMGGVCTALAQHFNWDVTVMRLLFITSLAFTGGLAFWVYAAMWLVTPFSTSERAPLVRFVDLVTRAFSAPVTREQPMPDASRVE